MAEASVEHLSAPPVEFKRMLSWQLSQAHNLPASRSKKKAKKKRKRSEEPTDESLLSVEDDSVESYAYIVVNSDGEEDMYYSAPESPISSEDEASVYSTSTRGDLDPTTTTPTSIPPEESSIPLPPQVRKPGGRSKKSKRKAKYIAKLAEAEFFQPLCELIEDKLCVEVGEVGVPSLADVPTLAELCIRKVQKEALVQPDAPGLPFLIQSLLGHDRELRSVVATHIRWLERQLAAYEVYVRNYGDDPESQFAYSHQMVWSPDLQLSEFPEPGEGLHCPLPDPNFQHPRDVSRRLIMKPLFHFANYFFPTFTVKGKAADYVGAAPLSPSQLAAIGYVNRFLKTRYKNLSKAFSETLTLWPGYVYWARGHLKLAASAFMAAVDSLKQSLDQATVLNEVGRMFLQFGDRSAACRFFRRAAEVPLSAPEGVNTNQLLPDSQLAQPCIFALEAAAWDCGVMDEAAARESARAWGLVMRESAGSSHSLLYLLHEAAVVARLFVHAGRAVGEDPVSPMSPAKRREPTTLQWLQECEQLISKHAQKHPILYYHLSLVQAMMGKADTSRRSFAAFDIGFSGFRVWPDGNLPGDLFSHLPRSQRSQPWQPLLHLLNQQRLSHAPVIPLQWRVRLLHPLYPYVCSKTHSYLAAHGSSAVGLRLTRDGYLTADIHMDLPPMRCVLLDPCTGSLSFSRSTSLQHYNLSPCGTPTYPDVCALPWPVRLFESDHCVVELVMGSNTDVEMSLRSESNYMAALHWYDSAGTHRKLDVRRIIRKHLRQALLQLASEKEMKGKEAMLDKMMEMGYYVHIDHLSATEIPPKYRKNKPKPGKGKSSVPTRKYRNNHVYEFALHLNSYVLYGEGTLMLCFLLEPDTTGYDVIKGQVLMFVNCSSSESFLSPRVYCVGDRNGFQHLYPSPDMGSAFSNKHFRHIKYAIATRTERKPKPADDHVQLIFDENGDIVTEKPLGLTRAGRNAHHQPALRQEELQIKFSLEERLFNWQSDQSGSDVSSYNTSIEDEVASNHFRALQFTQVLPVPGLLFVHTREGMSLLHPGSLRPVVIDGLDDKPQQPSQSDQQSYLQFRGVEMKFNIVKVYNIEPCLDSTDQSAPMEARGEGSEGREQKLKQELQSSGRGDHSNTVESSETSAADSNGKNAADPEARKQSLGLCDFGSCRVAFILNNRLMVLYISHRTELVKVVLDVKLPGKVTEFHPMGKFGHMVSVTQFPDQFREDIYWLSEEGTLLGMLPCLGSGPRSFLSATLDPKPSSPVRGGRPSEQREAVGGLHVFFSDGQGGICCVRPSIT